MQSQYKYRGISYHSSAVNVPTNFSQTACYRGANYQTKTPINLPFKPQYQYTLIYRGISYNYNSYPQKDRFLVHHSLDVQSLRVGKI